MVCALCVSQILRGSASTPSLPVQSPPRKYPQSRTRLEHQRKGICPSSLQTGLQKQIQTNRDFLQLSSLSHCPCQCSNLQQGED